MLFWLAIWIVVPPPSYGLLPFAVAVPELSPVLLVAAIIVALFSLRQHGARRVIATLLLLPTVGAAALPLVQWRAVRQRFDTAFQALPPLPRVDPPIADVTITRGIVFAEPGQRLTVDVYRPASKQPWPVLIQIYGGAWQRGAPGDDARSAALLARSGYVVMAIDYRHAPASPWPAQIDDVRTAIDWVIAHAGEYGGDARHIGLIGRSSGAQLALVEAYTQPARIAAVVSLYGPTDLAEGWRSPPSPDPLPVRPTLETFLGGPPDAVPDLYAAASPVSYVTKRAPPTLLIYGARDHIVEPRFGRELDAKLKAAGAASIYLELPWAEHAFDKVPGLGVIVTDPFIQRFLAAYLH